MGHRRWHRMHISYHRPVLLLPYKEYSGQLLKGSVIFGYYIIRKVIRMPLFVFVFILKVHQSAAW